MTLDQEPIQSVISFLESQPAIEMAILFGSFAHGTQTKNSDIDLALAGADKFSVEDRLSLVTEINKISRREVDLVDLLSAKGAILFETMVNGTLLFCKNTAIRESLLKRMWREQDDDYRFSQKVLMQRISP